MQHLRLMSLWAGHRVLLTALILAGAAVAATWTGQALLTSRIFTALVAGAPLSDPSLLPSILALAAVLLFRPLLLLARQLLAQHAMTRVKSTLRSRALSAFVRRSALDPAAGRTGRDHAVVVDGIENLDAYLSGYLPQVCVTVLVVGAVGTTMILVDPITGVIAVSAALLLPLLPRLWDRVLAARGADHWDAYQELHAEFVDSMRGMTTLVAFGADRRREDQLARASQHLLARTLGQLRISLVESGLSGFALAAVPALVLGVVIARRQDLGAFEIFILVLLSVELVRPLRDLAALWHAGYLGTFSGPRVMDLLDATAPSPSGTAVASRPRVDHGEDEQDGPGAVVVRDLTASYPRAEDPALISIDLRIGPGLTAIVGATGSGKSTLAAVLVGLLAPDRGSVGINGTVCDPDALLERVSLVPQDPVLLGETVGQDIALGLPDRAEPHHQRLDADIVAWAAATAGIGTDDGALSLESPVGQDGALLSGGQRQRVALARALAQQREILILDEATSALDPASETRLVAALRRNAGTADGDAEDGSRSGAAPTVIAITHRLAVAIGADHVVVLQQGRVVEQGPPGQLLARRGALSALVEAESSRRADAAPGTERGPDPVLATLGGAREGVDR